MQEAAQAGVALGLRGREHAARMAEPTATALQPDAAG